MKYTMQLPTDRVVHGQEFISATAITEMARAIETAGFDATFVTEHPFPAEEWLVARGHHALDPFTALSVAAAATSTLKLHTNILVLPYRNPFLLAKSIASLDAISDGRMIVGTAAGYLQGEFEALGIEFSERNQACDDALQAMKAAWSGETVCYQGRGYNAAGNVMLPMPVQRPHPPIWIGGNSRAAIRRAARFCQGWSPMPAGSERSQYARTAVIDSVETLAPRIQELRELALEYGREDELDVHFVPLSLVNNLGLNALKEEVEALAEIGVTWLSLGVPAESRAEFCDTVSALSEAIL